jgi:hypothetical protein
LGWLASFVFLFIFFRILFASSLASGIYFAVVMAIEGGILIRLRQTTPQFVGAQRRFSASGGSRLRGSFDVYK